MPVYLPESSEKGDTDMRQPGIRFWMETALALGSGALLLTTLASRTWIEALVKVDPDAGSRALERIVVGLLLMVTVTAVTRVGPEWTRPRTVPCAR